MVIKRLEVVIRRREMKQVQCKHCFWEDATGGYLTSWGTVQKDDQHSNTWPGKARRRSGWGERRSSRKNLQETGQRVFRMKVAQYDSEFTIILLCLKQVVLAPLPYQNLLLIGCCLQTTGHWGSVFYDIIQIQEYKKLSGANIWPQRDSCTKTEVIIRKCDHV